MDEIGSLTERLERVRFEAEQAERVADYETAARLQVRRRGRHREAARGSAASD